MCLKCFHAEASWRSNSWKWFTHPCLLLNSNAHRRGVEQFQLWAHKVMGRGWLGFCSDQTLSCVLTQTWCQPNQLGCDTVQAPRASLLSSGCRAALPGPLRTPTIQQWITTYLLASNTKHIELSNALCWNSFSLLTKAGILFSLSQLMAELIKSILTIILPTKQYKESWVCLWPLKIWWHLPRQRKGKKMTSYRTNEWILGLF